MLRTFIVLAFLFASPIEAATVITGPISFVGGDGFVNANLRVFREGSLDVKLALSEGLSANLTDINLVYYYNECFFLTRGGNDCFDMTMIEDFDIYDSASNSYSKTLHVINRKGFNYFMLSSNFSVAARVSGSGPGTFTLSVSGPATVPEPLTWVLFTVGFGIVGHAMRRRGATQAASTPSFVIQRDPAGVACGSLFTQPVNNSG